MLSSLAGCADLLSPNAEQAAGGNESVGAPAGTATAEVDVVGLVYESRPTGHHFQVTLEAAAGTGGTDWWQLETLGGEKLARHPFDRAREGRFTTATTVSTDGAARVVVRGHGTRSGYGGQVMLMDVPAGEITLERQGAKKQSFGDYTF